MRGYTDIDQSKKLTEILPLYSADMYYYTVNGDMCRTPNVIESEDDLYVDEKSIPCWSLTALLRELPDTMLGKDKDGYVVMVETMGSGLTSLASDPIDACVEMIIKLHEQEHFRL